MLFTMFDTEWNFMMDTNFIEH